MSTLNAIRISLALAVIGVVGCGPGPSKPTTEVPDVVNVGYLPMISSITHSVAIEKGLYKKHNLDVRGTKIATSNLMASQLVDGKIDASIELSVVPLLKAMKPDASPSFKIFSLSNIVADGSFDGVIVKSDSQIRTLSDLAGRRVATFPGTTASSCLLFEFARIAPGKTPPKCQPTAPDLQLQALETGSVDAVYAYEPALSRGIAGGLRLLPNSGIYALLQDKCPVGVAAVNAKFAADRPDVCKRLIAALDEAAQFVRDHPAEARQILARTEKVDPAATEKMSDLRMGTSAEVSFEALKKFEAVLAKMNEAGPVPLTKAFVYVP